MHYDKYILTYIKQYLDKNYNYVYLKTALEKGKNQQKSNASLVTGSSHSLCGIDVNILKNTTNCSMHSQDIYYDFKCAREVLDVNATPFTKCFIVMGYYMASQDLSKGTKSGNANIIKTYYPLFGDAHNCIGLEKYNPREGFELKEGLAEQIELMAMERLVREGNYYNFYKKPVPYQPKLWKDIKKCMWYMYTEEEKEIVGQARAEEHNKAIKYIDSFNENKEIFKDYIHYLSLKNIEPIVVVMPFARQYTKYVEPIQKEMFMELLNTPAEDIQYIDFNDADCFDDCDFNDADHLNENGAGKVSTILRNMFKL